MTEASGSVALSAGYHPIRVTYFEKNGGNQLNVYLESVKIRKRIISDNFFFIKSKILHENQFSFIIDLLVCD